jgi:uncharacterized protein YbjT (DUF2867 family)
MILVTGATGTIGGLTVALLAEAGHRVRAMGRDPDRLATVGGHELVETVVADFEDPETVRRAVEGADALLAVAPAGSRLARHDSTLVAAARAAEVRRIVKLSSIGSARDDWPGPPWHRAGEGAVRQLPEWTVLRPSVFASNALAWAAAARAGAAVPNPFGGGRQGVVDPRDVAAVAAQALTGSGHGGRTYTLTGPELLSLPEQAAIVADVLGRAVTTAPLSVAELGQRLRRSGADDEHVRRAEHAALLVRRGENAILSRDVSEVLGRPPARFVDWVRDHRAAFG